MADQIFALYGLVARFNAILAGATAEIWKAQKDKLPPDLDEEEQVAIETGIANGIRQRLFTEIEQATLDFARPRLLDSDGAVRRALAGAVAELERCNALLRVNLERIRRPGGVPAHLAAPVVETIASVPCQFRSRSSHAARASIAMEGCVIGIWPKQPKRCSRM